MFAANRPEAQAQVKAAGEALSRQMGLEPAGIFQRRTQASGTTYQAFTCPHCDATCGDMFVHQEFLGDNAETTTETHLPPTAVAQDHWCTGQIEPCRIPPPAVLDELARTTAPTPAEGATASVTVVPVGRPGGMPVHQVISRMFGGGI